MEKNNEPYEFNNKKKHKIRILDSNTTEFPMYLMVVSQSKLKKIMNSVFYFYKRLLLSENNIYLICDEYKNDNIIFYNNSKQYKTVYKKFDIKDKIYYIPLQEYSKFYLNHKIQLCSIIAETLGVEKIKYKYNKFTEEVLNVNGSAGYECLKLKTELNLQKEENTDTKNTFTYLRGECEHLFSNFDDYLLNIENITNNFYSKKDINNDFELKQLIHSRLVGNLCRYEIKYETSFLDTKEFKLIADFNINVGFKVKTILRESLCVSLDISFYKTEEMINNLNMTLENNCLRLILNKNPRDINMMKNFIEKYISSYVSEIDSKTGKVSNNYFNIYYYIKILNSKLLDSYVEEIKSIDDLLPNGSFFTNLRSTLYASLITFDNAGFQNLQKIYLLLTRENNLIEVPTSNKCFNMRCTDKQCDCREIYKPLKSIFCYFIRVYNEYNQNNIITYGYKNNKELCKTLHYVAMNIKNLTSFDMLKNLITEKILEFKKTYNSNYSANSENSENSFLDKRTDESDETWNTENIENPISCKKKKNNINDLNSFFDYNTAISPKKKITGKMPRDLCKNDKNCQYKNNSDENCNVNKENNSDENCNVNKENNSDENDKKENNNNEVFNDNNSIFCGEKNSSDDAKKIINDDKEKNNNDDKEKNNNDDKEKSMVIEIEKKYHVEDKVKKNFIELNKRNARIRRKFSGSLGFIDTSNINQRRKSLNKNLDPENLDYKFNSGS
jgi:hypothetical protein